MTDKTTFQLAEEAKLKVQQEALAKIQAILEENQLTLIVNQVIQVVPKK